MTDPRLMTASRVDEDAQDEGLRPRRLDDYIGQDRIREQLHVAIEAACQRGEALDHTLLYGPPGLGKTHQLTILLDAIAGSGWHHHTAHSTPRALVDSLRAAPYAVHLFEDCEKVLKTELSASILRAGVRRRTSGWRSTRTAGSPGCGCSAS